MVSSSNDNLLTETGSGRLEDVEDDLLVEIVPFKPGWDSSGRKIIPGQRVWTCFRLQAANLVGYFVVEAI